MSSVFSVAPKLFPELLLHIRQPAIARQRVRAEFFGDALFLAVDQRAVLAELVAGGGVDQVAAVRRRHLEKHEVVLISVDPASAETPDE